MVDDLVNEHLKKAVASSKKNFVNFIKLTSHNIEEENCTDNEIDFLIQRISQNMLYYRRNIETAKTDYHTLIGMLIKKGLVFKEFKDMREDPNGYE